MNNLFLPNDRVKYVGEKFAKELNNKVGFVITKIENSSGYCVEFGDDSYVISEQSLKKHIFVNKDEPEVRQIRRRYSEDD